jgi:hypothetical protein
MSMFSVIGVVLAANVIVSPLYGCTPAGDDDRFTNGQGFAAPPSITAEPVVELDRIKTE